jgi:hypothetical protein
MLNALYHVYLLALGEFNNEDYEYGTKLNEQNKGYKDWQWALLNIYFIGATFIFLIHLMNMLIAIMGETFGSNNSIKDK